MPEIQDEINEVLKVWRDRLKGRIVQAAVDIAEYEDSSNGIAPARDYEKLKNLLDDLQRAESIPAIPAFIAQGIKLASPQKKQADTGPAEPGSHPDS